jgi:hypothetical protein
MNLELPELGVVAQGSAASFEISSQAQLIRFPSLESQVDVIRKFLRGAPESQSIPRCLGGAGCRVRTRNKCGISHQKFSSVHHPGHGQIQRLLLSCSQQSTLSGLGGTLS